MNILKTIIYILLKNIKLQYYGLQKHRLHIIYNNEDYISVQNNIYKHIHYFSEQNCSSFFLKQIVLRSPLSKNIY